MYRRIFTMINKDSYTSNKFNSIYILEEDKTNDLSEVEIFLKILKGFGFIEIAIK